MKMQKNVLFHFAIMMSVIAQNVIMQSGVCTECCGAKIKGQCIFFVLFQLQKLISFQYRNKFSGEDKYFR